MSPNTVLGKNEVGGPTSCSRLILNQKWEVICHEAKIKAPIVGCPVLVSVVWDAQYSYQ